MEKELPLHDESAKFQYLAAIVGNRENFPNFFSLDFFQYFSKISNVLIFLLNLLTIGYGTTCGWTSPSIALLTSDETPLASGKITMDEASNVASFLCIGGVLGNIFFGFITNLFGRKWPLILISVPTILS